MSNQIKDLVRYAIWAPSGHNSQPWKFGVKKNELEVWADFSRRRPEVDPVDRELYISLGCAIANVIMAAEYGGMNYRLKLWPEEKKGLAATFLFDGSGPKGMEEKIFRALRQRHTNRNKYEERLIPTREIGELKKFAKTKGVKMWMGRSETDKREMGKLIYQSHLVWYKCRELTDELTHWLKQDVKDKMGGEKLWLTRLPEMTKSINEFVDYDEESVIRKAKRDEELAIGSSVVGVVLSTTDNKLGWIRSGIAYEMMVVKATTMGIQNAFLNPMVELAGQRKKLMKLLGTQYWPQLVFRLGYAKDDRQSRRRPVAEVWMA